MARTYEIAENSPPAWGWDDYSAWVEKKYAELLLSDDSKDEKSVQTFLEQHPCLVPGFHYSNKVPYPGALISQPKLSGVGRKIPDFLWIGFDSATIYPVFIEIETPHKKWHTSVGNTHSDFTAAYHQLKEWSAWFGRATNQHVFFEAFRIPSELLRDRRCQPKFIIAVLILLSACTTSAPGQRVHMPKNTRVANLQRAAALPWRDGGQCVVREAAQPWPVLVERCFQALDHERIEFHDTTGRCAVASAGAAAVGLGFCVLVAPEIVAGAVIVLGAVVVAVAIKEALDAYELRHLYPEEAGSSRGTRVTSREAEAQRKPKLKPEPAGQDRQPPVPPVPMNRTGRASCEPVPVPHAGKDDPHNECADKFPPNRYPGMDVLVGGVRFDALQVGVRKLWEIKTHQFDLYNDFVRDREIKREVEQLRKERKAALTCGYEFVIGVSTEAHKDALLQENQSLNVVVTGCKR